MGRILLILALAGCATSAERLRERGYVPIPSGDRVFGIDPYEVDQRRFAAFLAETPDLAEGFRVGTYPRCGYDPERRSGHPVVCVTLAEAQRFCSARGARLPTNEEWSLAAGPARWPTGDVAPVPGVHAWIDQPTLMDGIVNTRATDALESDRSPSGVYGMTGNVREWVGGADPATRGGALNDAARFATRATRREQSPDMRAIVTGFRCAVDAP